MEKTHNDTEDVYPLCKVYVMVCQQLNRFLMFDFPQMKDSHILHSPPIIPTITYHAIKAVFFVHLAALLHVHMFRSAL